MGEDVRLWFRTKLKASQEKEAMEGFLLTTGVCTYYLINMEGGSKYYVISTNLIEHVLVLFLVSDRK